MSRQVAHKTTISSKETMNISFIRFHRLRRFDLSRSFVINQENYRPANNELYVHGKMDNNNSSKGTD